MPLLVTCILCFAAGAIVGIVTMCCLVAGSDADRCAECLARTQLGDTLWEKHEPPAPSTERPSQSPRSA